MPKKKRKSTQQKKQEKEEKIKKAQEQAGIIIEPWVPLPDNYNAVVYLDPLSPVPLSKLDNIELREFWLHEETKDKWDNKRWKLGKNKRNFIEQNPEIAEIRLSHLKTCLLFDLPLKDSLAVAGISEKQYYNLKQEIGLGQVFDKWNNHAINMARVKVNMAIRWWNINLAYRMLLQRDPRYDKNINDAEPYTNQLINLFLNVSQDTKDLILSKYTPWTLPAPWQTSKNEKSTWWSNQQEARWFLSPDS